MGQYYATINWSRNEQNFLDNQYSRGHRWSFDGGAVVEASSSPHIVPVPYSVEANVDPEEAFVAALSSCHMLFFLSIAAKKRYVVDSYRDKAVGRMGEGDNGKPFVETVVLKPQVEFAGDKQPDKAALEKMHHQAHELCFIANSVKTEVLTEIS